MNDERKTNGLSSLFRVRRSLLLVLLFLLAGCQKGAVEPVSLAPEDMCAYCKMALSEKRYAAEFIAGDGEAYKFDDIGCMINLVKSKGNKAQIAAYFVTDFAERQWIKAEDAYYVRSPELQTPMNGQLIAFKDGARAAEAVGRLHGRLLRFNDLFSL